MTNTELLQKALDVLEAWDARGRLRIIESIKARLAQPEPEPVAWMRKDKGHIGFHKVAPSGYVPLYTAPPKKEWVGLTNEEINILFKNSLKSVPGGVIWNISRTIEAKLKEKNT